MCKKFLHVHSEHTDSTVVSIGYNFGMESAGFQKMGAKILVKGDHMKTFQSLLATTFLAAIAFGAMPASAQELIVNGGFEQSSSPTVTPTGWTNIGHSDGVITYAAFGTPVYEGLNYYDFGGYGNSNGPAGDGIQQAIATVIGTSYILKFGLSSENSAGTSVLQLYFNNVLSNTYTQGIDGTGLFKKPFTLQTFSFTATSALTTIKFLEGVGSAGGNGSNDPLIDGVSFRGAAGAVPEPATWGLMVLGFGMIGAAARSRKVKTTVRFA